MTDFIFVCRRGKVKQQEKIKTPVEESGSLVYVYILFRSSSYFLVHSISVVANNFLNACVLACIAKKKKVLFFIVFSFCVSFSSLHFVGDDVTYAESHFWFVQAIWRSLLEYNVITLWDLAQSTVFN